MFAVGYIWYENIKPNELGTEKKQKQKKEQQNKQQQHDETHHQRWIGHVVMTVKPKENQEWRMQNIKNYVACTECHFASPEMKERRKKSRANTQTVT